MSRQFSLSQHHWIAFEEPFLDWEVVLLALAIGLLLGL